MAQIEVKFDHSLELSPIVIPLNSPGIGEKDSDPTGGNTPVKQTMLYGVRTPLVKIGDIVVDADDILTMELNGSGPLPTLYLEIQDSVGTIKGLQQPGSDSEVRLQILPRFENAYKKIDMKFYIKSCTGDNCILSLDCIYKVPDLYASRIKCFGERTTYELFETIASECRLGFASNLPNAGNDKRYLYCAYTSYLDLMRSSIETSGELGHELDTQILYDYWVDFWNNLNLVDVYERYQTVDKDEDIMIYVSTMDQVITQDSMDEEIYFRTPAVLSNDPAHMDTELHIDHYDSVNNSSKVNQGSDRVISIYNMDNNDCQDYFIQDGDQKKDIFVKYEYVGENYGEYNYQLASRSRRMMKNKMKDEIIEVVVQSPLISLMRGSKVNVKWYDINAKLARKKQALGISDDDIDTNIPIPLQTGSDENPNSLFRINKQVSGQYYILNSIVRYEEGVWSNTLQLTRPRDGVNRYLDLEEATKTIK